MIINYNLYLIIYKKKYIIDKKINIFYLITWYKLKTWEIAKKEIKIK